MNDHPVLLKEGEGVRFFPKKLHVASKVAFIALCEGYLGAKPNLTLWQYFFCVELLRKKEEQGIMESWSIRCASIRLHSGRSREYIPTPFTYITRVGTCDGSTCETSIESPRWGYRFLASIGMSRTRLPQLEPRCHA